MKTIIELHDSTVAEIVIQDDVVVVHFIPAYLHKSEGDPGRDPGTGWIQEARLVFKGASVSGILPELPCDVIDGELVVDRHPHYNNIPVPLEISAAMQLKLNFGPVHTITVKANAVRVELLGTPRYVEDFGV